MDRTRPSIPLDDKNRRSVREPWQDWCTISGSPNFHFDSFGWAWILGGMTFYSDVRAKGFLTNHGSAQALETLLSASGLMRIGGIVQARRLRFKGISVETERGNLPYLHAKITCYSESRDTTHAKDAAKTEPTPHATRLPRHASLRLITTSNFHGPKAFMVPFIIRLVRILDLCVVERGTLRVPGVHGGPGGIRRLAQSL